jgi:hypothetical protein
MVKSYGFRGIGTGGPLGGARHDVEEDGAFEVEEGESRRVDGETVTDSGAAVVAGEDDGLG